MNSVTLVGRLTHNPEIRVTQNGSNVATFSVAVDRRYQQGERKTDFFKCTCFGNRAELIDKYFVKGSRIAVTGELNIDSYTTKDGIAKTAVNVIVDNIAFIDTKEETAVLRARAESALQNAQGQTTVPSGSQFTYSAPPAAADNKVEIPSTPILAGFDIDNDTADDDLPF